MAGSKRHFGYVLFTSLALAFSALTPLAMAAPAVAIQPQPPTIDDFKSTLSAFGQFIYSERYGNVWQPSSLPAGWHPYPACHWVYDRTYGWTYDDPTTWGKIVHHYGRWAHDDSAGWVWVPGTQWSPGWVIWRSGSQWTGWAPTPPTTDQQETSLASFNSDKQWTFIETDILANRCNAAPAEAPAAALSVSAPVTNIKIVRGIAVYVLPPPAAIIDYDTGPVAPWPTEFLGEWISWLAAATSSATLSLTPATAAVCLPTAPAVAPYISTPPAPPSQKSTRKRLIRTDPRQPRPSHQRVIVNQGPGYTEEPTIYVGPPPWHRPPPDWGRDPVNGVPPHGRAGPYQRSGPAITPYGNNDGSRYPGRQRRPPDYGEPIIQ